MSPFRPRVVQVQHQGGSDGLLEIEIPDLHVTHRVIHIDRVVVADGVHWLSRKSVLQREMCVRRFDVDLCKRKRRLEGQVLCNVCVGSGVVIDAVPGAHHRVVMHLPGDAHARRKRMMVGIDQGDGIRRSRQWADLSRQNGGDC